jgi:hypothetical protein
MKQTMLPFAFTLISAISFFPSFAQESYYIPYEVETISEAVQLADNGDTLFIGDGVYTDSVHIMHKHLIIIGNGKPQFVPGSNGTSFHLENARAEFWYLPFTDNQNETPPPNFAIKAYSSDVKISHCHFQHLFSPVSLMGGELQISNCEFRGTRGSHAISLNLGTFLIYNNLIVEGAYQGISINRSNGALFNNTILGTSSSQHFGIIINADAPSQVFNNIIANFGIGLLLAASDSTQLHALEIDHNNVYLTAAPYWYEYNESLNLPIYSGSFEPEPGTGEISQAVQFEDVLGGNYRLQAGAAVIDNGRTGFPTAVAYDLDGVPRISGSAPDIGAYEFQQMVSTSAEHPIWEVKVFPMPVSENIQVALNQTADFRLFLYSMEGKLIQQSSYRNSDYVLLPAPHTAGTYLLVLRTDDQLMSKKVIVR